MNSSQQVKKFLLDNLSKHQKDIIQAAIRRFGISRQAVHKHMNYLINDKKVAAHGNTKGRYYELMPTVNFNKTINIGSMQTGDDIIKKFIEPNIRILSENIFEIFHSSTQALINNIFDHANASKILFKIYITHKDAHFIISDNGIGIFDHLKSGLNLFDEHLAALELAKGHVTTDPHNHSGDELYTVIHLFDKVKIDSSGRSLGFSNYKQDWSLTYSPHRQGSRIHLTISPSSKRTCKEIFNNIFHLNDKKVRIPLNLLDISEHKVVNSRSQVESVLRNIKDFNEIEFDFKKIDLIGPSFADELVRKTIEKNYKARIKCINANETVDLLMSRALAQKS